MPNVSADISLQDATMSDTQSLIHGLLFMPILYSKKASAVWLSTAPAQGGYSQ
jgi:hypothetical protein